MNTVLRHLRRAALLERGDGPSDGRLLEAFLAGRDEAAFEALLRRHGPMVLGVCRRVLGNRDDAEDAFQATFLVLVRKAAAVRPRELVGHWLWGVAYRTALKARAMSARRRARERQAREMARSDEPGWVSEELLGQLDRELARLPDKYRAPVVLCELEGRSRREAARALGLAEGTLSWRLARARKLLARKLARHGPALSAAALTAALAPGARSAALPPLLLTSTRKAGAQLAAGRALAGAAPAQVAALTEGVIKAMFLSKLKVAAWAVGVALLVGAGAVGLTYRASAQQPGPRYGGDKEAPPAKVGRPAADDLESLRLEIEALRRELRATKDQVKELQAEVRGQKAKAPPKDGKELWGNKPEKGKAPPKEWKGNKPEAPPREYNEALRQYEKALRYKVDQEALSRSKATDDPLAELEDAVKRLRKDPKDKLAYDALDHALRRLKERPKPNKPADKAP